MGFTELAILLMVLVLFFSMPLTLIFVVIFISRSQRRSRQDEMKPLEQENLQIKEHMDARDRSSPQ
jgi:preprotein translocase subunit YajC